MDFPKWWYLTAYAIGFGWILAWECIAAWVDRGKGDTISEFTWTAEIMFKPLAYIIIGVLVWLALHLFTGGKWA